MTCRDVTPTHRPQLQAQGCAPTWNPGLVSVMGTSGLVASVIMHALRS